MSRDDALSSYLAITNTSSVDHARAALEANGWDLQRAVARHFDSYAPQTNGRPATSTSFEPLEVDDSDQAGLLRGSGSDRGARAYEGARGNGIIRRTLAGPLAIVATPISVVLDVALSIFRFIARLLRIRLPSLSFHWPRSSRPATRLRTDPTSCAERWIRSLEEETGALSSTLYDRASTSGLSTSPTGEVKQRNKAAGDAKGLPNFFVGGYEDALRKAREEMKILMVVLVTDEHDDVGEFKRHTLTDPDLLAAIGSADFIAWGGDVRDRDAFSAAHILDATTYPFIAFVALQPQRTGTVGSSQAHLGPPRMNVASRLEGRTATQPDVVIAHITNTLLPRSLPYLERLRGDKRRRELERRRREEEERASEEAGKRDYERIMKKKAEMEATARTEAEALRRKSEEQERKANKVAAAEELKRKADAWRAWARTAKLPPEPAADAEGVVRISFRLGNGQRIVRRFSASDPAESLYVFVDVSSCEIVGSGAAPPTDYDHRFGFRLSTAMPRKVIDEGAVGDYGLHGATVNVEGLSQVDESESEGED